MGSSSSTASSSSSLSSPESMHMRAVLAQRGGSIPRVFVRNYSVPQLTDTEADKNKVKVHVRAASLNPIDYKVPKSNVITGKDFAGVVVESRSPHFAVGDRVFGGTMEGTLAEYVKIDHDSMAKMPSALSFVQAASLPVAFLSAYQGLKFGKFARGEKICIIGASGGCGSAAVQLARAIGGNDAEIVGVCSSKNADFVKNLGANSTRHYDKEGFTLGEKKYYDLVYDTATGSGAGENYTAAALEAVKADRKLVAISGTAFTWIKFFTGVQTLLNSQHSLIFCTPNRQDLTDIANIIAGTNTNTSTAAPESSSSSSSSSSASSMSSSSSPSSSPSLKFEPCIDRVLPFTPEGVEEGFQLLMSRRARGKIVIDMTKTD